MIWRERRVGKEMGWEGRSVGEGEWLVEAGVLGREMVKGCWGREMRKLDA